MTNQPDTASEGQVGTELSPHVERGKLVPGASVYFDAAVREYAEMLFAEARNIEDLDHTGSGPAEITAAHVEEAKWLLARRHRRRARHSGKLALLKIGQLAVSVFIGVGASNIKESWGAVMMTVAVVVGALLFIAERELTRD